MSHYDRGGRVSPEDEAAWESQNEQILALLLAAPRTNVELHGMGISLDPSRRMYDLAYKRGYYIRSERVPDQRGVWRYSVQTLPDPEHDVDIRTIFPDGYVHFHTVTVIANDEAKAKNIAQHFHVLRKIMAVRRVPIATGAPRVPPTVSGEAVTMTRLYQENQALRMALQRTLAALAEVHRRWRNARKNGQDSGEEAPA